MKLDLVATCLFGLEKQLGEEIDALGAKRTETMQGKSHCHSTSTASSNRWGDFLSRFFPSNKFESRLQNI